ncbi:MAG: hypothetical protein H6835_15645 [Planctomycetes bacterium]|nr:hypothetical protein [Planctomycetota bacterium]
MRSLSPLRRLLLAASLLLAPLGAQTTAQTANRFVPADSTFVIRVAAPARWKDMFAKTQAGKLLQSNTLAPLVQQIETSLQMQIDETRDSGKFDADLIESMMTDWQGDLIITMQMDMVEMISSAQMGVPPQMSGSVVMTPGGSFDLQKFSAEVMRLAEEQNEMHDLVLGDLTLRAGTPPGREMDLAIGADVDGAMVMLFGPEMETTAERLLAKDHRSTATMGDGPLFVHMDLSWISSIVDAAIGDRAPPEAAAIVEDLMRTLGAHALRGIDFDIDTEGEHVLGGLQLQLTKGDRGLFDVFGTTAATPKLLRAVPANAEAFSVNSLDLGKLYAIVAEAWTTFGDEVPVSFDDAMQAFADATKVRLKEDLIDHLAGEMMSVQDVESMMTAEFDADEENPLAMFGGTVYGFGLKDGAAFGQSLETALRSRGMHAGRKTEEYGDQKVHSLKLGGLIELEYVVTDDLLLLGVGKSEGTSRALRSVLDARAAGEAGLPEVVRKHAEGMPAGWSGIGTMPLAAMMNMLSAALAANPDIGEESAMARMMLGGLAEEMTRLGIGSITSATYVDQHGITARMRW